MCDCDCDCDCACDGVLMDSLFYWVVFVKAPRRIRVFVVLASHRFMSDLSSARDSVTKSGQTKQGRCHAAWEGRFCAKNVSSFSSDTIILDDAILECLLSHEEFFVLTTKCKHHMGDIHFNSASVCLIAL